MARGAEARGEGGWSSSVRGVVWRLESSKWGTGREGACAGARAPIYVYPRPTLAVTRAGSTHPDGSNSNTPNTNKHAASPSGRQSSWQVSERPDLSAALKSSMLMVPTTTLPNLKLLRGGGGAGASAVAGGRAHAKAE